MPKINKYGGASNYLYQPCHSATSGIIPCPGDNSNKSKTNIESGQTKKEQPNPSHARTTVTFSLPDQAEIPSVSSVDGPTTDPVHDFMSQFGM